MICAIAVYERMYEKMRNPERLAGFYNQIATIHKNYCPDIRFGQLMTGFFDMLENADFDPYYIEESQMLELFYGYVNDFFR